MSNTVIKYNDAELEEFKQHLLNIKEKTEKDIESFQSQFSELTENGKDENNIDDSGFDAQMEYLLSHKARGIKHLRDIENALLRIQNKVYGVCTVTGKLIDKKRLMAVPTTTKSLEGKQILSSK